MDANLLQQQLITHIEALEREGYVDNYLRACYGLKKVSGVTFFVDLIATFLIDSAAALDDMSNILAYPILDYDKLYDVAIKFKGSSASIGACRMASGGYELMQAIIRSKKDCDLFVENLKRERSTWEIKLETIMQLEREIINRQMQ